MLGGVSGALGNGGCVMAKLEMTLEQARSVVGQFVWNGTDDKAAAVREDIAKHMSTHGTGVLHACWELYGQAKGAPCYCSPCMAAREGR